jgi:hypothetical protein
VDAGAGEPVRAMVKTVGAITTAAVRVDAQGNGMHPNALTVCAAILAGCFVALLAALLSGNRRRRTPDIRIRAVRAVTERGPASDSHFGILLAELSVQRT